MSKEEIDWSYRKTMQVSLRDIKETCDNHCIEEDAPIVFKNVIGYDEDKDYFYTWEMWVDSDTKQIVISMQPADWYYGKKAKDLEDKLQEEYEEEKQRRENEQDE